MVSINIRHADMTGGAATDYFLDKQLSHSDFAIPTQNERPQDIFEIVKLQKNNPENMASTC